MTFNITPKQKQRAAVRLWGRERLKNNRDHNRNELMKFRLSIRREKDLERKAFMKKIYAAAKARVAEQTTELMTMANYKIANKVGITERQLRYFDMSPKDNWREQV